MHKVKEHIECLEHEQSRLLQCLKSLPIETCEKSKEDYYYLADIAKDIAGAMKDEAEAAYYKCLAEKLHDQKEEDEMLKKMGMIPNQNMGYDNWRYSSGKFAPTGKGHYVGHGGSSGYTSKIYPIMDDEMDMSEYFGAYVFDPTRSGMEPKYYTQNANSSNHNGGKRDNMWDGGAETGKGRNYDNFMRSRRHYTETKDQKDKEMMKQDAKMHMRDIESSMMDIWNSADPDLKKELKNDMSALISKMPV